jgi:hypothetical protein
MAEGNGRSGSGSGAEADVRESSESSPKRSSIPAMPHEECVEGIRSALKRTRARQPAPPPPPPRRILPLYLFSLVSRPPLVTLRALTPPVDPPRRSHGAVPEGADGECRVPGVAAPHPGGDLLLRRRLR